MAKAQHRAAAGTKAARQLASQNSLRGIVPGWKPDAGTQQQADIAAWNAEVERRRVEKKVRAKLAKRGIK